MRIRRLATTRCSPTRSGARRGRLTPFALITASRSAFSRRFPARAARHRSVRTRRRLTEREPLVFDAGPPRVRRLAIVSGAGADYLDRGCRRRRRRAADGERPSGRWRWRESPHPPDRRGALRHGDLRGQAAGRAPGGALRACVTFSSMCPTRSEVGRPERHASSARRADLHSPGAGDGAVKQIASKCQSSPASSSVRREF